MKRVLLFASVGLFCLTLNSCAKKETAEEAAGLSQDVLNKIEHLGFNSNDAFAADGGYIVEGCIFLSEENLNSVNPITSPNLLIADNEQYQTFNLVTGMPRQIRVAVSGTVNAGFSQAIDDALARYNAESLEITFLRVTTTPDITIKIVNTGQYIASAGFPSGGNPFNEIKYAKKYTTGYSNGFMTTVLAHELGHCIGFRHTDYMNRAYSCGSGGNEGASTVGAVHIPGTPTGPDAASFMLACLGATTNRPFNANDKTALNYLY